MFLKYTEYLAGLIALAFGLLKRDFGYTDDANYATADIASQTSFQEGIRPIADAFIEALDQKAVNYYHEGFSIELADRNPQKELDEANRSDVLFSGGIATRNEARQMNGLKPVLGGGFFRDSFKDKTSAEEQNPREKSESVLDKKSDLKNLKPVKQQRLPSKNANQKFHIQASQLSLFD